MGIRRVDLERGGRGKMRERINGKEDKVWKRMCKNGRSVCQCGYRKKIGRDERLDGDFGGISTRGRGKREAEWSGREKRKKRGEARKIKR